MREIELDAAADALSRLVESLHGHDEIVLTRAGKGVAKLTALPGPQTIRLGLGEGKLSPVASGERRPVVFGRLAGQFKVPDDFDAPLPDDLLDLFEGKS